MSADSILEGIKILLAVTLGGFVMYYKSKVQLIKKVSGLIAEAEDTFKSVTKSGGQKFEWVVDRLFVYVPAWLRPLITKEVIGRMVQFTFDSIEKYAKTQLDKLAEKVNTN